MHISVYVAKLAAWQVDKLDVSVYLIRCQRAGDAFGRQTSVNLLDSYFGRAASNRYVAVRGLYTDLAVQLSQQQIARNLLNADVCASGEMDGERRLASDGEGVLLLLSNALILVAVQGQLYNRLIPSGDRDVRVCLQKLKVPAWFEA
jgi:hypothetical protein